MEAKRGEIFYKYFHERLKEYTRERNYEISLPSLKTILGKTFHMPKDLLFMAIKDLVENNIIAPTTPKRWQNFKVLH